MYEFEIKIQKKEKSSCKSFNEDVKSNSSRSASIVHESINNASIAEESLIVTLDSIQIRAKKTTTPRRPLNGFSM